MIASFIFVFIIPVIIISITAYLNIVQITKENYEKEQVYLMKMLDANLSIYMSEFERLTKIASLDEATIQAILKDDTTSMYSILKKSAMFDDFSLSLVGLRPDVEGVYFYKIDEWLYYTSNRYRMKWTFEPNYNIKEEKWIQDFINSNKQNFVIPTHDQGFKETIEDPYVITIARKIWDYDKLELKGIFFIDIKPNALKSFLHSNNNSVVIVDKSDTIVYDTDDKNYSKQFKDIYNIPINHENIHEKYIIYESKFSDWRYIIIEDTSTLTNDITRAMIPVGLATCICMLLLLLTSYELSLNITKPIIYLRDFMKKVQKGNFKEKVSLSQLKTEEMIMLGASFNVMVEKIDTLIAQEYQLRLLNKDAEFRALQSQINPHFLYNTLESINCLAIINDNTEISQMIQQLTKMFRYSVDQSREFSTIKEELDHINNYVKLQNTRYDNKFKVIYNIEPSLLKVYTIKLLLQPIVENAIYHGIEPSDTNETIVISVEEAQEKIIIKIKNTGVLIQQEHMRQINKKLRNNEPIQGINSNKSIGLSNINNRLKLYYKGSCGIQFSIENKMTCVTMTLLKKVNENV